MGGMSFSFSNPLVHPNSYGRVSYIVIGRVTRFRWLAIKSFPKRWPIPAKRMSGFGSNGSFS
jgi:hypothetical protein